MNLTSVKQWRDGRGYAVSVLLHLAVALLWLWWHLSHPLSPSPPLPAMNVDLVAQPALAPGTAGGASVPVHAPQRSAPRIQGVTPQAIASPPDEVEARIRGYADLRAPESALPAPDNDGAGGGTGSGGGYALADFVRAQILRRWWPDLDRSAARGMPVTIRLTLSRNGVLSDIRIVDQARFNSDKLFHDMALSARNAARNASPIALPPGRYAAATEITITLDPSAVLR
jgi:hypothetical protein